MMTSITTTTVRKLIIRQFGRTIGIIATADTGPSITATDTALADDMVKHIGEQGYYDLVLRIDGKVVDESIEIV